MTAEQLAQLSVDDYAKYARQRFASVRPECPTRHGKSKFRVGDVVTVRFELKGYGSEADDRPKLRMIPGMEGVVASVNVPPVTGWQENFLCIDYKDPATGKWERCAASHRKLKLLRRPA